MFRGDIEKYPAENPIPTKYILAHTKIKVNIFFRYYSTDFFQEKNSVAANLAKILIDFFVSIVYDKIAKYGMPIQIIGST